MLGLGSTILNGGTAGGKPPISELGAHSTYFVVPGALDDGSGTLPTPSIVTLGDIRFFGSVDLDPTKIKVTSCKVGWNSGGGNFIEENATELVTTPIQMDSKLIVAGVLFFYSDAGSVMDDHDFGSSSAYVHAHNGTAQEISYRFRVKFTHDDYEGEIVCADSTSNLSDSDA